MSILIKGMKMPASCSDCGQFRWDIYLQNDVCRIAEAIGDDGIFQSENEGIDKRPSWCPLIELPPHGRLIDADELYALYDGEDIDDERYHVSIPCIKQNITDMLTILESDVGECITTNADYIRHMCDEKLAWWLGKICPDAPFAFAYPERSSEELWLSWLKEEEGLYE